MGPDARSDFRAHGRDFFTLLRILVTEVSRGTTRAPWPGMRRQDYFGKGSRRGWLRLHEKGGKRRDSPSPPPGGGCPRRLRRGGQARGAEGSALPERGPGGAAADGPGARSAARAGDDQASRRGRAAPALDVLPHVPGDRDQAADGEPPTMSPARLAVPSRTWPVPAGGRRQRVDGPALHGRPRLAGNGPGAAVSDESRACGTPGRGTRWV